MTLPRITIVTPSYNQAPYLQETIESVLSQGYSNLEYMVIDGGSTDGSVDIIKEFSSDLAYWVSEKDHGQSDAIYKGFQRATGDLICWLNSDDILLPGCLVSVAKVYERHRHIDIITSNVVYLDQFGKIIRCVRTPAQNRFFLDRGVFYFQTASVFFRRTTYECVGGIDKSLHYSMDLDLWFRFSHSGARVHHIPLYLGGFRRHVLSKTVQYHTTANGYSPHPETYLVLSRYCPRLSRQEVTATRLFYRMWQVANLNYLRAWIDSRRLSGQHWLHAFGHLSDRNAP